MNLSDFEVGIDFNFDSDQIVFAAQDIEEGTKISVHLFSLSDPQRPPWQEGLTTKDTEEHRA